MYRSVKAWRLKEKLLIASVGRIITTQKKKTEGQKKKSRPEGYGTTQMAGTDDCQNGQANTKRKIN